MSGEITVDCICWAPRTADNLAGGFNLPAMVAAEFLVEAPIGRRLHLGCRENEYFDHVAVGMFVPFLWYLVGRLIDNKYFTRSRNSTWLAKFLACVVMLVLLIAGAFLAKSLFVLPHSGPPVFIIVCMLGWIGFGIAVLLPILRRGRDRAAQPISP